MSLNAGELAAEELEAQRASKGRLRRELSSFAVLLLTLSSLSPVVSVFGVGGDVLHQAGSGAAILFGAAILAALVWSVVYAELGSAYPYAGGDYVGVGSVLGGWAGVVVLVLWAVTAGPSIAFSAQALVPYVGQLAPRLPAPLITFGGLAGALALALLSVRRGALVTGLFLAVETVAVVVLIVVGASHPARGPVSVVLHPVLLGASGGGLVPVTLSVLGLGAVSAVYATVGGNQAINFGEELHDPHRRMGRVVLMACLIGAFATALPVVFVVLSAPDLGALLRSPAPFAQFLATALGPWAGPALSAGVALAIFNANIVSLMGCARLYFSLGRDGLFPAPMNRLLSAVDAHGTPRAATLVVAAFTAACCFLPAHTLLVFISGLLVYGWSLVCLAVLEGRRKGLTGASGYWRSPLFP